MFSSANMFSVERYQTSRRSFDSMRESGNGRRRPCSLSRRIGALPWPSLFNRSSEPAVTMIKLRVGCSLFREARAEIASSFIEVVIVHSNRSCNSYAHDLARSSVSWDPCAVPVYDMERPRPRLCKQSCGS